MQVIPACRGRVRRTELTKGKVHRRGEGEEVRKGRIERKEVSRTGHKAG